MILREETCRARVAAWPIAVSTSDTVICDQAGSRPGRKKISNPSSFFIAVLTFRKNHGMARLKSLCALHFAPENLCHCGVMGIPFRRADLIRAPGCPAFWLGVFLLASFLLQSAVGN